MPAATSRLAIIGTILKKDLTESLRDRLWILLSALGLVFYVVIFWLLPASVEETLTIGIRHTGLDIALQELREAEDEGLNIVEFETAEQLKSAITAFGFTNPILIDEAGVLNAGHGRLRAATDLGMEDVPTIVLSGLSEPASAHCALPTTRSPLAQVGTLIC